MANVFCVRADFGKYTNHFLTGEFAGIGWFPATDLSHVKTKDEIYSLYKEAHPKDTSNLVIGQQVGQIARFLFEMKAGDYVITPAADTEWLHFGRIAPDPSYFYFGGDDGCRYRQRRRVEWDEHRLRRGDLSVPFQKTMGAALTVFAISQKDEFFSLIGKPDLGSGQQKNEYDSYRVVLEQLLELDEKEFEILVGHVLSAVGFDGTEVVGKPGDGGVDATGELNVAGLAKIKIFVQAKRYKIDARIAGTTVKQLRQSIPSNGQGAFITTADFQKAAHDVALETGFPRIGLVNGRQLVDLLIEHWDDIDEEFRKRLGLRTGLVRT